MNDHQFRQNIVSAFSRMSDLNLTGWDRFPNQSNLKTCDEFRNIALGKTSKYENTYKAGLNLQHYNFILEDYSYFQFSKTGPDNNPSYRYTFYSNPYEVPSSFLEFANEMISQGEIYQLGELYSQELDEAQLQFLTPPIRYDYDPHNYTPTRHPVGHLHIGIFQGSRIAVRRVLTPLTFSLFVAKNFYPEKWATGEDQTDVGDGFINKHDRYLADAKKSCKSICRDYFSETEEQLPYFD